MDFTPGEKAQLRLTIHPSERLEDCLLGFVIYRATDGLAVCDYNLPLSEAAPFTPDSSGAVTLAVDLSMNLLRGAYAVSLYIYHLPTVQHLVRADRVAPFFVSETVSRLGVSHLSPVVRHVAVSTID